MPLGRPRYLGDAGYDHASGSTVGILLANLGTPAAPTAKALRPYLREFLSDPRVIEYPRLLWWFILNGIIVPFRSPRSANAYRKVWDKDGSPLLAISRRQSKLIAQAFAGEPVAVELGMSYGKPSLKQALRNLHARGCRYLIVLPLYPQYAASTVGSVFDAVSAELSKWRWVPQLRMISGYCQQPDYPQLLAACLREAADAHGAADMTVFSFHGTQLASLRSGDPYHCQCHRTAREAAQLCDLPAEKWLVAFQSRFGNDPWLQPYMIEIMKQLPARGVKKLHVICPAFSADCLETLEEICGENKEAFLQAGGEQFTYVPALNDRADHIEFLVKLLRAEAGDWFAKASAESESSGLAERKQRAAQAEPLTTSGLAER